MTEFHSCLRLNSISVCIHPILPDCIPLLWMDTLAELYYLYPFTVDGYLGWAALSVSLYCGWIPWLSFTVWLHLFTVDGYLSWVALSSRIPSLWMAAVNSSTANMGVQGAFRLLIPFSLSSCWVLQLYDQLWGYVTVFSTMAVLIYNPINNTWDFLCTQYLIKLFFLLFNNIHSNWGELISHYSLIFPW